MTLSKTQALELLAVRSRVPVLPNQIIQMKTRILLFLLLTGALSAQIRVNVGGPQYTDSNGLIWSADTGCTSASTYSRTNPISGTNDPTLYRTARTDPSSVTCTYNVVSPAFYTVSLLFAETDPKVTKTPGIAGAQPRILNIYINGQLYWSQVNVFGISAFATAVSLTSPFIPVSTGQITIQVTQLAYQAMLSAIDIEPVQTSSSSNIQTTPQAFGAAGNGTTDDTASIQAALDFCGTAGCQVIAPGGSYKITNTLKMYRTGLTYSGEIFCGNGAFTSNILWYGPPNTDAIQMDGYLQTVCNLRIVDSTATGWRDAIGYGAGDLTTSGVINHVFIECNYHPGNGISLGRLGIQGDQAVVEKPEIVNCTKGFGIAVLSTNAVDNVIINPSITNCWIGLENASTSTDLSVFGGSINDNSVNEIVSGGSTTLFSGIRTEGSGRNYFDTVGSRASGVTWESYTISSITVIRTSTTVTGLNGACSLPLTFTDNNVAASKFTFGDFITVAGGGGGGSTLHTQITAMTSPTNATIIPCLGASVVNASIALDGAVHSNQFEEHSGGAYVHNNVVLNLLGEQGGVSLAIGPQVFNGWATTEILTNPLGAPSSTNCPSTVSWVGMTDNISIGVSLVPNYVPTVDFKAILMTPNNGTSANNAIVGFSTLWCTLPSTPTLGTIVTLSTGTFTLQAGANTLNLHGLPWDLKSHRNPTQNIAVGYSAGSQIQVVADPGDSAWLDLSQ